MAKQTNVRKLTKAGAGRSMAVTLPAELVRSLGWREHQKVTVKKIGGALVVRDFKTKKRK